MAALFSVLLASCTSTGTPSASLGMPGYAADGAVSVDSLAAAADSTSPSTGSMQTLMTAEGDAELPAEVAYLPSPSPGTDFAVAAPTGAETIAGNTPRPLQAAAQPAAEQTVAQADVPAPTAPTPSAKPQAASAPAMDNAVYVTAGEMPKPQAYAAPKKKSLFASLFGSSPAEAAPAPVVEVDPAREAVKPVLTLASAEVGEKPIIDSADEVAHASINGALPGVRQTALFEIRRRSGVDDESDVDLHEDEGGGLYQVASAAGFARLAPTAC